MPRTLGDVTETASRPRWLSDAEQRTWRAYITATVMVLRLLDKELRDAHDISLDDYGILAMLSEAPDDRARFGELAAVLRVPKAHITYRFKRLAERGLVRRERCETDGRGAFAALTAAGRRKVEEAAPTHVDGVRRHLLDHLDPDALCGLGRAMTAVTAGHCDSEAPPRF